MAVASPARTRCPAELVTAIRGAVGRHGDWQQTAAAVTEQLRARLPGPEILTGEELAGDPDGYVQHLLHSEPDGSFSVCALVWRPGQQTPVHDHVTWCVVGVLRGTEYEELFALRGGRLEPVGRGENRAGSVSGFAPPGDIHRVRNVGSDVAVSLHVYGADIARLGTSVRRVYDVPVSAHPA